MRSRMVQHAWNRCAGTLLLLIAVGCGSSGPDGTAGGNGASGGNGSPDGNGEAPGGADAASNNATRPTTSGGTGAGATEEAGALDAANPSVDAGSSAEGGSPSRDAALDAARDGATAVDASSADGPDADSGAGVCAGGQTFAASNMGSHVPTMDFGWVQFSTRSPNQLVGLDTTLIVPAMPPPSGTLFLWPGIQPDGIGSMDLPINNGVLQSVLTWGPTCAPNAPNNAPYASWWISGQYVNTNLAMTSPEFAMYGGCHGGPGMDVAVGDSLDISMTLSGTDWTQTVTDAQSGKSITYTIDMMGQVQDIGEFVIENAGQNPVTDVTFTQTTLTFATPEAASCQPQFRGANDYFSAPQASVDGMHCCVSKIILRAQGVAATSPDSP